MILYGKVYGNVEITVLCHNRQSKLKQNKVQYDRINYKKFWIREKKIPLFWILQKQKSKTKNSLIFNSPWHQYLHYVNITWTFDTQCRIYISSILKIVKWFSLIYIRAFEISVYFRTKEVYFILLNIAQNMNHF